MKRTSLSRVLPLLCTLAPLLGACKDERSSSPSPTVSEPAPVAAPADAKGAASSPAAAPPLQTAPGHTSASDKIRNDGPVAGFTDGWQPAAWAGSCAVSEARTQAARASISPLVWRACASGRADCKELVSNWTTRPSFDVSSLSADARAGASARVVFAREHSPTQREWLVVDAQGGIEAAWRSDGGSCADVAGDLSGGALALTLATRGPEGNVTGYSEVAGDPQALIGRAQADYTFGLDAVNGEQSMHTAYANDDLVAMTFTGSATVAFRDRSTGRIDHAMEEGAFTGIRGNVALVGRAALYSTGHEIAIFTAEGGRRSLIGTSDPNVDLHDVTSDGSRLAYVQSTRGSNAGTLNVGNFSTNSGDLSVAPLRQVACSSSCNARMSGGYITLRERTGVKGSTTEVLAIRASDGATTRITPVRTSTYWESFSEAVVVNDEVWIRWEGYASSGTLRGIQRIKLASQ